MSTGYPWFFLPAPMAPSEGNSCEFPTLLVYTSKNECKIGWEAQNWLEEHPEATGAAYFLLKYRLGDMKEKLEFSLPDGSSFEVSRETLTADFLRQVRDWATQEIQELIESGKLPPEAIQALDYVTLSKPAKTSPSFDETLEKAGFSAGFQHVLLYEEPLASYQTFLKINHATARLSDGELFLIVDIGGGTTDLAIIEKLSGGDVCVRNAHEGGEWAAGWKVDYGLWEILKAKMLEEDDFISEKDYQYVESISYEQLTREYLVWTEVERLKRELCERFFQRNAPEEVEVEFRLLSQAGGELDETKFITVSKQEFERLIEDLVSEIDAEINKFETGIDVDLREDERLRCVLLTGGSSRIRRLRYYFRKFDPAIGPMFLHSAINDQIRDGKGQPFPGMKSFVSAGCATRWSDVSRRRRLLQQQRSGEKDESLLRDQMREQELVNPTLKSPFFLYFTPDRRRELSIQLGDNRKQLALPWAETVAFNAFEAPLGTRITCRLEGALIPDNSEQIEEEVEKPKGAGTEHSFVLVAAESSGAYEAGGNVCDKPLRIRRGASKDFSLGIISDEIEYWLRYFFDGERREQIFMRGNACKLIWGRLSGMYRKNISEDVEEKIKQYIESVLKDWASRYWDWSLRDLGRWLMEQAEDHRPTMHFAQHFFSRPNVERFVLDALAPIFRRLQLELNLVLGEDGVLDLDMQMVAPGKSEQNRQSVELKRRAYSIGPFFGFQKQAQVDKESSQGSPWSLGIDFGTSGSMVSIAIPQEE